MSDASNAVTLFAPTNGAFGADSETQTANIDKLLALPKNDLVALVAYQAVEQVLKENELQPGTDLTTLSPGETLAVVADTRGFVQIKGAGNAKAATIVDPNRAAGTSIIQGLDKLLVPSNVTLPS